MPTFAGNGKNNFCSQLILIHRLSEYLLKRETYYCGTLCINQKRTPKQVTQVKLKKGDVVSCQSSDGVKISNWKDKCNVLTIPTVPEHGPDKVATGKKSRGGQDFLTPQCVIDYYFAKKGVDVSGQMSSYNSALRKTRKLYRKVAIELITGTSVVNAWVIYNKFIATKKTSLFTFQESLINQLVIGEHNQNVETVHKEKYSRTHHTLLEAGGSKQTSRKRCRGCYETISAHKGAKIA